MVMLDVLYYIYLGSVPQVDALLVHSRQCQQVAHYIKHEAAVAGVDPSLVARIMLVESNCKVKAFNKRTKDGGLMQINRIHNVSKECIFDARCNIRAGAQILAAMSKWSKYRHCVYNIGFRVDELKKTCETYENKLRRLK